MTHELWNALVKEQVKEWCHKLEEPTSGNKPDMISRLLRHKIRLDQLKGDDLYNVCVTYELPVSGTNSEKIKRIESYLKEVKKASNVSKPGNIDKSTPLPVPQSGNISVHASHKDGRDFIAVGPNIFRVVGVSGSSDDKSPHKTWLKTWKVVTGREAETCMIAGCTDSAAIGGHFHAEGDNERHYIGPICSHHNSSHRYNHIHKVPQYYSTKPTTWLVSMRPKS